MKNCSNKGGKSSLLFRYIIILIYVAMFVGLLIFQINCIVDKTKHLYVLHVTLFSITLLMELLCILIIICLIINIIGDSKRDDYDIIYRCISPLNGEMVYGELYCSCGYNDTMNQYVIEDNKYFIREFYIDKDYQLKYIDHYVNINNVEEVTI